MTKKYIQSEQERHLNNIADLLVDARCILKQLTEGTLTKERQADLLPYGITCLEEAEKTIADLIEAKEEEG